LLIDELQPNNNARLAVSWGYLHKITLLGLEDASVHVLKASPLHCLVDRSNRQTNFAEVASLSLLIDGQGMQIKARRFWRQGSSDKEIAFPFIVQSTLCTKAMLKD